MKLMLGTHSSNPDSSCECDYALVDLNRELAWNILRKLDLVRELNKKEDSVSCVSFHAGCNAQFFEYCDEVEEIQSTDGRPLADGVWNAEGITIPEEMFQRTECDRLIIYANGNTGSSETILFQAVPKHASIEVETDYLPLELIQQAAKEEPSRA